ncbi:MAG: hypothetical protein IPL79_09530 [Myxococcales bacterium]|nr:hypothetical protein [Myxococcales bacterium]
MNAPDASELAWTAHPARRRPHHVALLIAITLFAAYAVLVALQSFFLCGLAIAILLASTASFWLPTHYQLDGEGVRERRWGRRRRRSWAQIRRLVIGPQAALISPFARPHPLDRMRGLMIYFDGGPRDEIVRRLRAHAAPPALQP